MFPGGARKARHRFQSLHHSSIKEISMAAITAALIKQVREETGAGMMDVKKALTEAEGDVARAKEIIRAKGIQAAGKREGRKAQEGTIASTVVDSANGQTGYAVELNSETDFVAKTPKFVDFADTVLAAAVKVNANGIDDVLAAPSDEGTVKESVEEAAALFGEHVKIGQFAKIEGPRVEIYAHKKSAEMPPSIVAMIATDEAGAAVAHEAALQISAMGAQWLSREDVPEDIVESERRVATEKSLAEGKPEKIVPKIVEGRLNAFFKENVLLEQAYVKDPSKTIGDLFKEVGGQALAFARLEVGKGPEADAE
jgi:elongation factor Ts